MGILDAFKITRAALDLSPVMGSAVTHAGIRSPWSTGQLQSVVLADIFNTDAMPVTRAEAMSLPAVAKARHLICSPLAVHPLTAYRGAAKVPAQPAWLYRTNSQTAPQIRMLWTLDDLLFGGWSLWAVERGKGDQITDAVRVPPELWTFGGSGQVEIDGVANVEPESVILFSGPFEGLLEVARKTIRAGTHLEQTWAKRAANPIPAIDLHQTTDDTLEPDEIQDVVDAWADARNDPNGAIAYTPYNIQANALGQMEPTLFIEGRNAIRLDVANFAGLPANLLDASKATASLTYSTQEGSRNEFADYSLGMWTMPIEARLSMDDVAPRGTRIAFDLEHLFQTPPPTTAPATED